MEVVPYEETLYHHPCSSCNALLIACSLCARMRRGALHDLTKELGCNKIALGHHLDDAIETFYMNLWNEGRIGTFSPVTYLSRKDITMLRPMFLAWESDVINAMRETKAPIVKSTCPMDGVTNRQNMKNFISERCKTDPSFRQKSRNNLIRCKS